MIKIVMTPLQREHYLEKIWALDGITHIKENKLGAYCPISLTSTPDELKPILKARQEELKTVLTRAEIEVYDPSDSKKYNPDFNKEADFKEVYGFDSEKVLRNRFFSGHVILPSTGFGNEAEKAVRFNRIPVMFIDQNIRISRMIPYRTIYIQYENFEQQADDFIQIFEMLKQFEPGMGLKNNIPILMGFDKNNLSKSVDLEEAVYSEFPHLQYHYNGDAPILKLRAENPELFYKAGR